MPDLSATLHVCRACGHIQGLLSTDEACTACQVCDWQPHEGKPRQKALMPTGGRL